MGDRRMGDRRSAEEGVIKIKTQDAIVYLIIAVVIITSVTVNIILGILYNRYKDEYNSLIESDYESDYEEESEIDEANNYTCNVTIEGSKTELKAGEIAEFQIKATDIDAGNGIVMFETSLDYDSDMFECTISGDDSGTWNKLSNMENYVTMSRSDLTPNDENQTIAKITIKAKDNITAGEQEIALTGMKFTADNEKSFTVPDEVIKIQVIDN